MVHCGTGDGILSRVRPCRAAIRSDSTPRGDDMVEERRTSLLREGVITGIIGATTIVLWFLMVDTLGGRPLFTPRLLGAAMFSVLGPPAGESSTLHIAFYTVVHYVLFIVAGLVLAAIVRRSDEDPNVLAGLTIGIVVFLLAAVGFVTFLSQGTRLGNLAWYQIGAATLLASILMGAYLWRTHPRMGGDVRHALEGRER